MDNQEMEVQTMEIQAMENNSFKDMPPNFPDLQGENLGLAGWFQTEFMPWIQSLDLWICGFVLWNVSWCLFGVGNPIIDMIRFLCDI